MKRPQEFAYLNYSCVCPMMSRAGGRFWEPLSWQRSRGQSPVGGWWSSPGMLAEARGLGKNYLLREELPTAQPSACASSPGGLLGSSRCKGWLNVVELRKIMNQSNTEMRPEPRRWLGRSS